MEKSHRLKADYTNLEQAYRNELAEKLDLTQKYQILSEEHELALKKLAETELLSENTRRLKHDMQNHIMVIASHLNHNEPEKAREYLSVVLDRLNRSYSYIQTGNSVMNYLINSKLSYASQNAVRCKAEIENLPFARMGSVDFSALLGNALDNAIEACLKIPQDSRELFLSIRKKRGYDTITIKNRILSSVLTENPELLSTKPEPAQHGLGLLAIRKIVEKYDGLLDIYEEDVFFCLHVMIPSYEDHPSG